MTANLTLKSLTFGTRPKIVKLAKNQQKNINFRSCFSCNPPLVLGLRGAQCSRRLRRHIIWALLLFMLG